jgi:hypothetical protein
MHLDRYARAVTKGAKSAVVCEIYSLVQDSCPRRGQGAFVVRRSAAGGDPRWYECGMKTARRRITSALRECLPDRYPSSNAFRRTRKRQNAAKKRPEQQQRQQPPPPPQQQQQELRTNENGNNDNNGVETSLFHRLEEGNDDDDELLARPIPLVEMDDWSLSSISSHNTLDDEENDDDNDRDDDGGGGSKEEQEQDFNRLVESYPELINLSSLSRTSSCHFLDDDSDDDCKKEEAEDFRDLFQSYSELNKIFQI